jgi:hypothetical protein
LPAGDGSPDTSTGCVGSCLLIGGAGSMLSFEAFRVSSFLFCGSWLIQNIGENDLNELRGRNFTEILFSDKNNIHYGKKAAKEKIKVNDVVVDKMSEYFKVQDKGELYRYMKANKIYNSEEPA